jgi:hypothetical protein
MTLIPDQYNGSEINSIPQFLTKNQIYFTVVFLLKTRCICVNQMHRAFKKLKNNVTNAVSQFVF